MVDRLGALLMVVAIGLGILLLVAVLFGIVAVPYCAIADADAALYQLLCGDPLGTN
jgi:hypothetical protein